MTLLEASMPKFSLGSVIATRGAMAEFERLNINPVELIGRHALLDQGCLGGDGGMRHALREVPDENDGHHPTLWRGCQDV